MAGSSAAEPFWTQPAPREQAEAAAPQVHRGAGAVSVPQNAGSGPVRVSGRAAPRAQRPCGPGSCVGTEQAQERRLTGPWGLPPRAVHIFKSVSAAVLFACASRHSQEGQSEGSAGCWRLPEAWTVPGHGSAMAEPACSRAQPCSAGRCSCVDFPCLCAPAFCLLSPPHSPDFRL